MTIEQRKQLYEVSDEMLRFYLYKQIKVKSVQYDTDDIPKLTNLSNEEVIRPTMVPDETQTTFEM